MNQDWGRDTEKSGPPGLSPPDSNPAAPAGRGSFRVVLICLAFLVLLAGVGAVLYLLPGNNEQESSSIPPVAGQNNTPEIKAEAVSAREDNRDEAEEILKKLLHLKIQAEAESVSQWAEKRYQVILSIIRQGDKALAEGNYPDAADNYRLALAELQNLLDSRHELFEALLSDAQQALDNGDHQAAVRLYQRALATDSTDRRAAEGSRRALAREEVLNLYSEADDLERAGQLEEAVKRLESLVQLDDTYQPGKTALARVTRLIENQLFTGELTIFYRAIEADQLGEARSSFESIKRLRPDHAQAHQAGLILDEKEETAAVTSLRKQAEHFAGNEEWQDALKVYQDILAITPEAMFAVNGSKMAAKRLELDTALADTISRPHRLQDTDQRQAAADLLRYAEQFSISDPRLGSQVEALQQLVSRANSEITVTLESDNMTDVTIYHIGSLGRFFSTQITLTPGKYTVVGSRVGYRDIRKTIEVDSGTGIHRFLVQCIEPI